ncbi:phthalate 3,4-dioxygenase beta subunit [Antricoccus suffuscus]|uniref:Phthalate 3,4-dioxygenase beta subunit n=1 Tax=Antricoccus suffuscus TaxID=1629062 RepID=A0A2T0ZYZ8_9ACTN|nr:3-phenylpropionate/cinnamic acid dioxygenase subunit beta [Antricoccus suffuscus]PRZ41573.1 phthalate 3,4-dioxygenase beta subunit [Antricoccus suffuscus]
MSARVPIQSTDSPLGQHASRTERIGSSLPFDDARHLLAHRWLIDEAYLLDDQDYERWLDLMSDDIHYFMPIRITTAAASSFDTARRMAHFDEDKYSLNRRVARLHTEHAWTEDPPSRVRHHLSNVRTFATDNDNELIVESAVLLFRSRGDIAEPSFVSAGRVDLLRREDRDWRLARRHITVDESVLRTQNLAVFL